MGMFDREVPQSLTPLQEIQQSARSVAERTSPFLKEAFGYESPERQMRRVASETDLNDVSSVQDTFNKLMSVNPEAALRWRKEVMPIVTANVEQQKLRAKSQASLFKPMDVFNNVRKDYDKLYCASQGVLGGGCGVPRPEQLPKDVRDTLERDEKGKLILPTLSEFASKNYGQRTANIVRQGLGLEAAGRITPAPTGTPKVKADTSTEASEVTQKVSKLANTAVEKGIAKESIVASLKAMKFTDAQIKENFPELVKDEFYTIEMRNGKEVKVPFTPPAEYDVQQMLKEKEKEVLSNIPGIFNY